MSASKPEEIQELQHPARSHAKFRETVMSERVAFGSDMPEVAIKAINAYFILGNGL